MQNTRASVGAGRAGPDGFEWGDDLLHDWLAPLLFIFKLTLLVRILLITIFHVIDIGDGSDFSRLIQETSSIFRIIKKMSSSLSLIKMKESHMKPFNKVTKSSINLNFTNLVNFWN